MAIQVQHDHGQKMPPPNGRAIGFVNSRHELDAVAQALTAAGLSQILVLEGSDGIRILERSSNGYFLGDAESDLVQLGIRELTKGHLALAVKVKDRDEAARAAELARAHGGHSFGYFGTWVDERLTP